MNIPSKRSATTPRRPAFSLVLSLTVMAMLLLLCIGGAALLVIQLRIARVSVAKTKARFNAIAGARIAFGEIQRLLGPDQRVTATADILCDPDASGTPLDISHYKRAAGDTYGGGGRSVVHPRWTGVWNSGATMPGPGDSSDGIVAGDEVKFIRRDATEGYLRDFRFANDKDWAKSRTDLAGNNRAMGWLVSGNEAIPAVSGVTPFTAIRATDEVIVGGGILGKFFNPSETRSDMLGVRVPAVTIPDTQNDSAGVYAYWVSDEGVKARANLSDPYEVAGYKPDGQGGPGHFRLMAPQRNNFTAAAPATDPVQDRWKHYELRAKTGKWANCRSFADLALADAGVEPARHKPEETVAANYLHDISFDSAGVIADVVNGGLRRDLTSYLETGPIAGSGSKVMETLQPSVLADATPILNDAGLNIFNKSGPVLKTLRSWSDAAPSDFNGAITPQAAPAGFTPYNAVFPLPGYGNQGAASVAPISPVLASVTMNYTAAYDASGSSKFKFIFYPRIVLWNPYDAPMSIADVEVYWAHTYSGGKLNASMSGAGLPGISISCPINPRKSPFRFAFPSMTLKPGESVCFRVAAPGTELKPGQTTPLAVGDPAANPAGGYVWAAPSSQPTITPAQEAAIGDGEYNLKMSNWQLNYEGYPGKGPYRHIYLLKSGAVLQEMDGETFSYPNLASAFNTTDPVDFRPLSEEINRVPDASYASKYRLLWINESPRGDDIPDYAPSNWDWKKANVKNTEMNLLVGFNARATRFTRFPCDMLRQMSNSFRAFAGPFQNDPNIVARMNDSRYRAQGSSSYVSPLFRNDSGATGNTRYAIYPVPRKKTGVLSLGALQGAPLIPFAWSTSMPVGNALPEITLPTDRSALGKTREAEAWSMIWCFTASYWQPILPSAGMGGTENLTQVDWSYELNHALWDSHFLSGIESGNPGWSSRRWDVSGGAGKRFRNARITPVRDADTGVNAALRVANTCLIQGAFNVNSTSEAAWIALLSAFRDIPVATQSSGKIVNGTPYTRSVHPDKGPLAVTQNATFDTNTWSGYRALSDEEIRKLAAAIVKQVRTRGPFLGLGDFVNRRLKKNPHDSYLTSPERPSPYYTDNEKVKTWETDYVGTLQAAIYEAGLNDRFDTTDYLTKMKRVYVNADKTEQGFGLTSGDGSSDPNRLPSDIGGRNGSGNHKYTSVLPRVEHLPRHKAAGAPAYLMQADILQAIGPVLAARSDTFKVRCKGISDEGAEAVVEIVVQRGPEALIPLKTAVGAMRNIPDAITSGPLAGVQRFGRRCAIVSLRHLDDNTF